MSTIHVGNSPSAVNPRGRPAAVMTARRWNGWYRATGNRRWRVLATSDDYATCLRQLRDAAPMEGGVRELLVSPCHRNPNQPRFSR
jgi:hypothetical protein